MASDANISVGSDIKQAISPNVSSGEEITPASAAPDGFFAQVSGNPFFTAVL